MEAINAAGEPVHPEDPGIRGCHHVQFLAPGLDRGTTRGTPWRSTPAGSTARRAGPAPAPGWPQLHALGELPLGADFVNESFIGTQFTGRLVESRRSGIAPAVVPHITGRAWLTGTAQYFLDPRDPFPQGFLL